MPRQKFLMTLPPEKFEAMDVARGDVPRIAWVEALIDRALQGDEVQAAPAVPRVSVPSAPEVRVASTTRLTHLQLVQAERLQWQEAQRRVAAAKRRQ